MDFDFVLFYVNLNLHHLLLVISLPSLMFIIFLCLLIIFIVIANFRRRNNSIKEILINNKNSVRRVIFSIRKFSGMCNNLRGIISSIFLSYLFDCSFILNGWKSITFYFKFPNELINNESVEANISFKRFNENVYLALEKNNSTIRIFDIHGFVGILLNYKKNNKK